MCFSHLYRFLLAVFLFCFFFFLCSIALYVKAVSVGDQIPDVVAQVVQGIRPLLRQQHGLKTATWLEGVRSFCVI